MNWIWFAEKKAGLFLIMFFCVLNSFALHPDDILGFWLVQEKDAKVEIFKTREGKYSGKIVWLEVPNDSEGKPRKDEKNKIESLQSRPLIGIEVVSNFIFNALKNQWDGGEVYNSRDGKIYAGYMRLNDNGTLLLRGHVKGFKFLGKTSTWTKTTP